DLGIKTFFCGPESFTADLAPIVGEAPELKNYFVAAGLNSVGIIMGPGFGRAMAHWITTGNPDVDITGFNISRLHAYQNNPDYRRHRTVESLGMVYQCHYPYKSMQTARGAKQSPCYDRLKAEGAYFRDVSGWESADWYAPAGHEARIAKHSWGREEWFAHWEA
ncbi:MAG TPA: FAD-dependent oxidoreductase, partial [Desulfosarcina sp.]|nr:FAD-dependent oxidoreductase [Desulfosarcina sp.]